jgi:hypothetical protein
MGYIELDQQPKVFLRDSTLDLLIQTHNVPQTEN